jgi:hypothetical protein
LRIGSLIFGKVSVAFTLGEAELRVGDEVPCLALPVGCSLVQEESLASEQRQELF